MIDASKSLIFVFLNTSEEDRQLLKLIFNFSIEEVFGSYFSTYCPTKI